GSDVVVDLTDGINTTLSTLEGTGFIQKVAGETLGEALDVAQGFAADTSAAEFKASQIPADVLQALQDEMKFTKLDVNETNAVNKAYKASQQQGNQGASTPQKPATPPAPQTNSMMDNIFTALRDILGFEIGSINVPDPNNPGKTLTYAKAVFQPTFSLGKLKMALYLPIIYQGDIFN